MEKNKTEASPRRKFLGTIATGAAALGLATFGSTSFAKAGGLSELDNPLNTFSDADEWFNKINGKHRIVYDVTEPKQGNELMMPFAWAKVFLLTNAATGTPEKESNVVTIWRHSAIPFAMEDRLWAKYKFGEVFNIKDDTTSAPALRNRFCVCNMAITVFSAVVAQKMNMKHEDVMKDWLSGILPGVQVVPSGVWAVGRAQEHKCAYCYAG
jgi:hypothetical protein